MTQKEIRTAIHKYGRYHGKEGNKEIRKVTCTVCGKEMMDNEPLTTVYGATITKRHTALFWHGECQKDVWGSRIH